MNRHHQISPLALVSLLIVFGSCISLSSCNSEQSSNSSQSPEPSVASPQVTNGQQSPQASGATGDTPVTAGLENSDRPGTDPLQLLENQQIKQELNLTADQSTKLKQIEEEFRGELRQKVSGLNLKELDSKQRDQKLTEVSDDIQKQVTDTRTKVAEVLQPDQLKRFKEITLQIYSFGPLSYDQFTQELGLTPEQQTQLNDNREQMVQKMRSNWQVPETNNPQQTGKLIADNRKRLEQIIKDSNDQALAVLTPEQQKTLETLKGEKFQLDPKQLPFPSS